MHKKRIEERTPDISGHIVPTLQDVLNREYKEWNESIDGLATVIWMDDSEHAFLTCLKTICGAEI